jgi:hypothetical protein
MFAHDVRLSQRMSERDQAEEYEEEVLPHGAIPLMFGASSEWFERLWRVM